MNTNRTNPDEGATDEPALTQKNTETVRGEETLAGVRSVSARTSYGAAGGTTDATEEGGDGTGI
jgi:hypothetical protein